MKRDLVILVLVSVSISALAVIWATVRAKRLPGLLSRPPAHGAWFVIEGESTSSNDLSVLSSQIKAVLVKRANRMGVRLYLERDAGLRFHVAVPVYQGEDAGAVSRETRGMLFRATTLEFRLVHPQSAELLKTGTPPAGYQIARLKKRALPGRPFQPDEELFMTTEPYRGFTGKYIESASVVRGIQDEPQIAFTLTDDGGRLMGQLSRDNIGHRLAIVVDGEVISAPTIQSEISKEGQITGDFDLEEARTLVNALENPFPVPIKILTEEVK